METFLVPCNHSSKLNKALPPITMSILPNNNYSRSHPSLFQTPAMDIQRFEVMDHAKTANPNSFWTIPVIKTQAVGTNGTGNHFRYDPRDPPFTSQEREEIVRKLKPIATETLSNAMPTLLFYFFFSEENIKTLQKNIRYTVNKYSGFNVGDASLIELRVAIGLSFLTISQDLNTDLRTWLSCSKNTLSVPALSRTFCNTRSRRYCRWQ